MKRSKIFFMLCMVLSIHVSAAEPSSEIPAQRSFPLSEKFKPCDDFHKYVCDEAEKSFKLREDRSRHAFSFNDSSERILEAKKKFFANIKAEKKLSARTLQVKNFYLACMDEKSGRLQEVSEFKKLKQNIERIKTPQDFARYQIQQIKNGYSSWINFGSGANQDQPATSDIILFSNLMNLPDHSYYENKDLMHAYQKLIIAFFKLSFPEKSESELETKAKKIIAFEKEFIKTYPKPEVRRQRWTEKRQQSQTEFKNKYPLLAVDGLLKNAPEKAVIFNAIPESFDFINNKLTAENLDVLKDFYLYKFGSEILDDSQPDYFNQQFTFKNKFLGGPPLRSARDERCTREVMNFFPKEIDQVLIAKMFPNFPSEKFESVVKNIRESILRGLQKNTWLEPATKEKALLKIEKAKLYLVQPKTDQEWYFLPIKKFSDKNRFENLHIFSKNFYDRQVKEIKEGLNLVAWEMGPLTVNAYYDPTSNKFVIPMGILQYPFFNAQGDLIENLGAVGAVIGHELGHGIDDQGSRYDETGRLNQWMTMKDLKEFASRSQKLVTQFNQAGHNGSLTLGENIGDLVGLTFAYNAAFPDGQGSVEDKKKLFIAYARLWCNVTLPKAEEQQLKTNPHALGWARINEQVKHQKSFAEVFQCRSGDKMNLPDSERVQIW